MPHVPRIFARRGDFEAVFCGLAAGCNRSQSVAQGSQFQKAAMVVKESCWQTGKPRGHFTMRAIEIFREEAAGLISVPGGIAA